MFSCFLFFLFWVLVFLRCLLDFLPHQGFTVPNPLKSPLSAFGTLGVSFLLYVPGNANP